MGFVERGEHDGDVKIALMVRREHHGAPGGDVLAPGDRDFDAREHEAHLTPEPDAHVHETALGATAPERFEQHGEQHHGDVDDEREEKQDEPDGRAENGHRAAPPF